MDSPANFENLVQANPLLNVSLDSLFKLRLQTVLSGVKEPAPLVPVTAFTPSMVPIPAPNFVTHESHQSLHPTYCDSEYPCAGSYCPSMTSVPIPIPSNFSEFLQLSPDQKKKRPLDHMGMMKVEGTELQEDQGFYFCRYCRTKFSACPHHTELCNRCGNKKGSIRWFCSLCETDVRATGRSEHAKSTKHQENCHHKSFIWVNRTPSPEVMPLAPFKSEWTTLG